MSPSVRTSQRHEQWQRIREAFKYCCAYCGKEPPFLHREHMMPRSRGGGNELENLVPSCGSCNSAKADRTPLEWFLARLDGKPERPKHEPRQYPAPHPAAFWAGPCPHCGSRWARPVIDTDDPKLPVYQMCTGCKAFIGPKMLAATPRPRAER